jgi:hypothetical protein
MLINFVIPARYRGGHPRTYMPPPPSSNITGANQWAAAITGPVPNLFSTMISTVVSQMASAGYAGITHCVPRYTWSYVEDSVHHKFHHVRGEPVTVYNVQTYNLQTRVCHQDRRLGPPIG